MSSKECTVSPYLRQPLRSYEEVIRDRFVKAAQKSGRDAGAASNRVDDEAAASEIPKRDPCREGEARRWPRRHLP